MDYLTSRKAYWKKGYHALNPQFGLTGEGHEQTGGIWLKLRSDEGDGCHYTFCGVKG
jgi:hypothetical protein